MTGADQVLHGIERNIKIMLNLMVPENFIEARCAKLTPLWICNRAKDLTTEVPGSSFLFNTFVILRSSIVFYFTPPSLPLFSALVILTYSEPNPLDRYDPQVAGSRQINNSLHFTPFILSSPDLYPGFSMA